jgi:hypothetical protein
MNIELSLRQLLVLRDPGVRFTDGVMARVGDTPVLQSPDGVVQLADVRMRRRSRRIVFVAVAAIGVAAAMPMLWLRDSVEPPLAQEAPSPAGALPASALSSSDIATRRTSVEAGGNPDPLACLDPDVIRGILLMGIGGQKFSIATELPPELTGFKAPRQFAWVGSTERSFGGFASQSTVSVVYRADLAPDGARTAGVQALTAAGWALHSSGNPGTRSLFNTGHAGVTGENYCRGSKPVGIAASAIDGVTYLVLSIHRNQERAGPMNVCDQPPQVVARAVSELDPFMPTLEAPRDRATGQPVAMQGGGSSVGDSKLSGSASFTIQDSVGNVAQHFAAQLAQQGWSAETSWIGTGTAGSTWTRRVDTETALQGTLMVLSFDQGRFSAVFRAVRTK